VTQHYAEAQNNILRVSYQHQLSRALDRYVSIIAARPAAADGGQPPLPNSCFGQRVLANLTAEFERSSCQVDKDAFEDAVRGMFGYDENQSLEQMLTALSADPELISRYQSMRRVHNFVSLERPPQGSTPSEGTANMAGPGSQTMIDCMAGQPELKTALSLVPADYPVDASLYTAEGRSRASSRDWATFRQNELKIALDELGSWQNLGELSESQTVQLSPVLNQILSVFPRARFLFDQYRDNSVANRAQLTLLGGKLSQFVSQVLENEGLKAKINSGNEQQLAQARADMNAAITAVNNELLNDFDVLKLNNVQEQNRITESMCSELTDRMEGALCSPPAFALDGDFLNHAFQSASSNGYYNPLVDGATPSGCGRQNLGSSLTHTSNGLEQQRRAGLCVGYVNARCRAESSFTGAQLSIQWRNLDYNSSYANSGAMSRADVEQSGGLSRIDPAARARASETGVVRKFCGEYNEFIQDRAWHAERGRPACPYPTVTPRVERAVALRQYSQCVMTNIVMPTQTARNSEFNEWRCRGERREVCDSAGSSSGDGLETTGVVADVRTDARLNGPVGSQQRRDAILAGVTSRSERVTSTSGGGFNLPRAFTGGMTARGVNIGGSSSAPAILNPSVAEVAARDAEVRRIVDRAQAASDEIDRRTANPEGTPDQNAEAIRRLTEEIRGLRSAYDARIADLTRTVEQRDAAIAADRNRATGATGADDAAVVDRRATVDRRPGSVDLGGGGGGFSTGGQARRPDAIPDSSRSTAASVATTIGAAGATRAGIQSLNEVTGDARRELTLTVQGRQYSTSDVKTIRVPNVQTASDNDILAAINAQGTAIGIAPGEKGLVEIFDGSQSRLIEVQLDSNGVAQQIIPITGEEATQITAAITRTASLLDLVRTLDNRGL
jgi:hypothetical protein